MPVRERIRNLIEESGPARIVGEAATVVGALVCLRALQPDVVVLDLNLPDGDGCTVLAEIKRTRPECVVIVLTNFAIPESRDYCRQLGADHFFNKSSEFERVPEVLAKLCKKRTDQPMNISTTP